MFWDILLDAATDSAKVLLVLLPINFVIAFLEPRLAGKVKLRGRLAPLVGVAAGLFPQCGFSVVATDLYQKRHITVGTLLGVYLATSDEALPIFLADPDKALHILPLLAFKFVIGLIVGYSVDAICSRGRKEVDEHNAECDHNPTVHFGCCAHSIESDGNVPDYGTPRHDGHEHESCEDAHSDEKHAIDTDSAESEPCLEHGDENGMHGHDRRASIRQGLERYLLHPLLHSAKIFAYVLVVNILFGLLIEAVGEDRLIDFLSANKYVAPLFAVIVGAIPNCVSSVVISNLYLLGGLGFGATLGGLLMNAGLGFAVLFKDRKHIKRSFAIFGTMFAVSVIFGYLVSAIFSFGKFPLA